MLNKSPSIRTWICVPESISRWLARSCFSKLEGKKKKLNWKKWSLSRPLCRVDINDDALQRACLRFRPNYLKGPILVGASYRPPLIWILDYIATVPFRTIRNLFSSNKHQWNFSNKKENLFKSCERVGTWKIPNTQYLRLHRFFFSVRKLSSVSSTFAFYRKHQNVIYLCFSILYNMALVKDTVLPVHWSVRTKQTRHFFEITAVP